METLQRERVHPVEVTNVWKRYQLGKGQDSLRDAIPALVKRLMGRHGFEQEKAGEFWALRDVSFHVGRGETVGIIGSNGAGKSTILKLLSRIAQQTRGVITVRGRVAGLIEVGAGFHPDLTGRENISLNGTIMGLRNREIHRLFDSIVEFSGIEKFLDMPVKRYSSGMNVRLGFAIAAHVQPDIMLIDEVLAVGDIAFQQKCYQRILDLKAHGTTMMFVSHHLEAVARVCDRVIVLNEGRVTLEAKPAEAIAAYHKHAFRKYRYEQVLTPHGLERSDTSHDVEFTHVVVTAIDGSPRDMIEMGEPFQVTFHYRTKRPIDQPSLLAVIERVDGLVCHEASTHAAGLSWDRWEGEGTLTLEYPSTAWLPNTYLITAVLYEGQNPAGVARMQGPVYFQVTSKEHAGRGVAQLPHRWISDVPVQVVP